MKQGTKQFEELTIIVEELPTLVDECPSGPTLFKQIGRLGRELRIRLVGLSQSERVKSLGISGEGDAKDNYTFIRLGKAAIGVLAEARTLTRPAVLEWKGEQHLLDLEGVLALSLRSIPSNRSWSIETPQTGDQKQPPRQRSEQRTKQTKPDNTSKEDTDTPLELWFHVEEIGQIAALIVSGMETREAVRAMPRYNRKKHRDYTAFYEQLKEAMNLSGGER